MTVSPQQLHSILQQQQDAAQKLLKILAREHDCLSSRDFQSIETILAEKQQCMASIESLGQALLGSLRRLSAAPKPKIGALLKQVDPQGALKLAPLWHQVEELLAQCRKNNSTNGKIIALSQRQVQNALSILRHGEAVAAPCYTPTGAQTAGRSSRTLGKV